MEFNLSVMKFTSMYEVIAKIIRDVGKDVIQPQFIEQMPEWCAEFVSMLPSYNTLSTERAELEIDYHTIKFPCGWVFTIGVEYEGMRLPLGGAETDVRGSTLSNVKRKFKKSDVFTAKDHTDYRSDMIQLPLNKHNKEYYVEDVDGLRFSMEEGVVVLHYRALPTDEMGYPLIPDYPSYKEAMYYWVLQKMMAAGMKHKVFRWQDVFQLYEKYLPMARSEVNKFTPEKAEKARKIVNRLILPRHFYSNFFNYSERQEQINHL